MLRKRRLVPDRSRRSSGRWQSLSESQAQDAAIRASSASGCGASGGAQQQRPLLSRHRSGTVRITAQESAALAATLRAQKDDGAVKPSLSRHRSGTVLFSGLDSAALAAKLCEREGNDDDSNDHRGNVEAERVTS